MNFTDGKTPIKLLAATLALGLCGHGLATCQGGENPAVPQATPAATFVDYSNGLVLHRTTQLIWTRCALGQSWTGNTCSGAADLLDWSNALQAAAGHEQAGQSDWRLPNRNELASIVETRCHDPAINSEIFPDSPAEGFWTSSVVSDQTGAVWAVDFDQGAVQSAPDSEGRAVRLVRGGRM